MTQGEAAADYSQQLIVEQQVDGESHRGVIGSIHDFIGRHNSLRYTAGAAVLSSVLAACGGGNETGAPAVTVTVTTNPDKPSTPATSPSTKATNSQETWLDKCDPAKIAEAKSTPKPKVAGANEVILAPRVYNWKNPKRPTMPPKPVPSDYSGQASYDKAVKDHPHAIEKYHQAYCDYASDFVSPLLKGVKMSNKGNEQISDSPAPQPLPTLTSMIDKKDASNLAYHSYAIKGYLNNPAVTAITSDGKEVPISPNTFGQHLQDVSQALGDPHKLNNPRGQEIVAKQFNDCFSPEHTISGKELQKLIDNKDSKALYEKLSDYYCDPNYSDPAVNYIRYLKGEFQHDMDPKQVGEYNTHYHQINAADMQVKDLLSESAPSSLVLMHDGDFDMDARLESLVSNDVVYSNGTKPSSWAEMMRQQADALIGSFDQIIQKEEADTAAYSSTEKVNSAKLVGTHSEMVANGSGIVALDFHVKSDGYSITNPSKKIGSYNYYTRLLVFKAPVSGDQYASFQLAWCDVAHT